MRAARIRPRVVRLCLSPDRSPEEQVEQACQAVGWVTGGQVLMTRVHWTDRPDVMVLVNYFELHEILTWSEYPNLRRREPEVTHHTWGSA